MILRIKNFQSWAEAEIHFSDGVTQIIGSSTSGKSALFRALILLMDNKPRGKEFISWWANETEVTLEIDGSVITRIRGKTRNIYTLNSGKPISPETSVPSTISNILNIRPDINIQHQIGAPFLLQDSPGQVAQFFNSVAGISKIDTALKYAKGKSALFNSLFEDHKANHERITLELEKYTFIDEMEKQVQEAEKIHGEYIKALNAESKLSDILNSLDDKIEQKKEFKGTYKLLPEINRILTEEIPALQKKDTEYKNLQNLIRQIKEKRGDKENSEKALSAFRKQFMDEMPDTCPLCGRFEK